jgi:CBS domain containing-hemolysin-like protein
MTGVDILLAVALVAANGFFVATEFALARLRPSQVQGWERRGRPGAKSVRHAVEHIDAYLAACQLGITLASLGLGVVGEPAFEQLLSGLLGDGAQVGGFAISAIIAFATITLLHVVVGELAPKSVAIARTASVALAVTPIMRVFYLVARPLVDLFNGMGNLLLKPFGIPPAREAGHAPVTEDELRVLVRESALGGEIEDEEGRFTENVLTFGDRRAREVMVPRHRAQFVTTEATRDELIERIHETGRTRLPLCEPERGLDTAIGLLHAKDVLVAVAKGDDRPLADIARPIERVPESILIDELLERLRRLREHFALVIDEHGTVVGLITLEDVLEEIVGEIEDEFDPQEREWIAERDGTLVIAGWAPIRLVAERLGLDLEEHHEATIGGLILEHLGRPPEVGETVEIDGIRLQVTAAGEARIKELRVVDPAGATSG